MVTLSVSALFCLVLVALIVNEAQTRPAEAEIITTKEELEPTEQKGDSENDGAPQKRREVSVAVEKSISGIISSTTPPERARVEVEGQSPLESKPLKLVQNALLNFIHPTPLVDRLKEEDKYGNNGEKFNRLGRGFVDGVAAITNFFGSAVDAPVEVLKSISRKATKALNDVGTKLIGL